MQAYKDILESTIEHEFFKDDGEFEVKCLDENEKKNFEAVVTFLPVEDAGASERANCGTKMFTIS